MPNPIATQDSASPFDAIRDQDGTWSARKLMVLMGYTTWRNFTVPLGRAMKSAEVQGHDVASNFAGSRKVSASGPDADDYALSRFAAYLVAMNGDPNKLEVAQAQAYFATKTREAEVGLAQPAPAVVSRRDLAQMVLAAEDEADRQRERAEVAEQFKSAIERNEGLSPRAFHKHYFPDVTEREFFDLLYKRRLLIDQRRNGTQRDDGTFRNGSQHGHPGFAGKAYFYVDSGVNQKTGYRFEQTLVRPGQPEVALVNHLAKLGLTPQTSKELAHV